LAISFSSLVLLKHLFAPLALPFAFHLLINYCNIFHINSAQTLFQSVFRFTHLLGIALVALTVAFLPFIHNIQNSLLPPSPCPAESAISTYICTAHLGQIFSRLFPFGRGLVHAYWAPNFWALYLCSDKVLTLVSKRLGVLQPSVPFISGHSSTSGIVGDFSLNYLPRVSPALSLSLVCLVSLPAVLTLALPPSKETKNRLIQVVQFVALSNFMFGYHVHEKAYLVALIPSALMLTLTTTTTPPPDASPWNKKKNSETSSSDYLPPLSVQRVSLCFMQCSAAGIVGLFPLFTGPMETILKASISISSITLTILLLRHTISPLYLRYFFRDTIQFPLPSPSPSSSLRYETLKRISRLCVCCVSVCVCVCLFAEFI
jgi:hypothetical protein